MSLHTQEANLRHSVEARQLLQHNTFPGMTTSMCLCLSHGAASALPAAAAAGMVTVRPRMAVCSAGEVFRGK